MGGFLGDIAKNLSRQAAAAANPSRKPAPKKRKAPSKPSRQGALSELAATVVGTASGSARAVEQATKGKTRSPAQVKRMVERDRQRVRRTNAIRSYVDAPLKDRRKQAAAAEKRVLAGRASERDRLIVETHDRRARNDDRRSRAEVDRANDAHDAAVRRQQVARLMEGLGKSARGSVSTKPSGVLAKLADGLEDAPGDVARAAGDVAGVGLGAVVKGAEGIEKLSKLRVTPRTGAERRMTSAGIGVKDGDAAKVLARPVQALAIVANEGRKDPLKVAKDVGTLLKDIPAALVTAAQDPPKAARMIAEDYKRRYAPLIAGREDEFRKRLEKDGIAPEVLDFVGLASGGSTATAKVASGTAKGVERVGRAAGRATPRATAVRKFINDPRPDLVVAPGRAKPQRKGSGLIGIAVRRKVDKKRRARVERELHEADVKQTVAQRRAIDPDAMPPGTPRQAKRIDRQIKRGGYGDGLQGPLPGPGQVVPLSARNRARAARKAVARPQSNAFRQMDRLANEISRPAQHAFQALSKREQLAAVHALEGTINPANVPASLRAIDARLKTIAKERAAIKAADPDGYASRMAPLLSNGNLNEVVRLKALRAQLVKAPDKVFTKRLRAFVEGERARRPGLERIARDELAPGTMTARRFAPAGELVGTREAYVNRRAGLDRLAGNPSVSKVLADIGRELREATGRERRALQAQARAVRDVQARFAGDTVPDAVLARSRTIEADQFAIVTKDAAGRRGLDASDPTYVLHRAKDDPGNGAYSPGGGEFSPARSKRTDMTLFRAGIRDTSDATYALGLQQSIKRSTSWRMTNELFQDLVPEWSKNAGNGFTRREVDNLAARMLMDPSDWVAIKVGTREANPDNAPLATLDDLIADRPNVQWKETDRFMLVPRNAVEEMRRGGSASLNRASRAGQQFQGLSSQAILGTRPDYALRQIAQNVPMVLVTVGGRWIDPVMWRNLRQYRKAAKLNPTGWKDMLDVLGVRSKSMDAVRVERAGGPDVRLFEGSLRHAFGGLYGARLRDYMVSPRRSPTAAGTASQAARTTVKTGATPLRVMRDLNIAIDVWQDRLARTLALAATDARRARGVQPEWAHRVAESTGNVARKLGPIARALELPDAQLAKLNRSKAFRHELYDAADEMTRWLGDYANFTHGEQKVARAAMMFYGFARHSTRLLVYELPVHHPFVLAATLAVTGVEQREKERLFIQWMEDKHNLKVDDLPNDLLAGYKLLMRGGDELEVVDTRWMNPLTGQLFEVMSNNFSGATSLSAPVLRGALESASWNNIFTKQNLSNAQGQVDAADNPLTFSDSLRVVANRFGGSLFPYRVWNDIANGERGKLTDTSLLFDPQEYPYAPGGVAGERDRRKEQTQRDTPKGERIRDLAIPLRGKSAAGLLSQAQYRGKATTARKTKKRSTGGGYGAGSSGGYGGGGTPSGGGYGTGGASGGGY